MAILKKWRCTVCGWEWESSMYMDCPSCDTYLDVVVEVKDWRN